MDRIEGNDPGLQPLEGMVKSHSGCSIDGVNYSLDCASFRAWVIRRQYLGNSLRSEFLIGPNEPYCCMWQEGKKGNNI